MTTEFPNYLTHYYEKEYGPFLNLSMLDLDKAEKLLEKIRQENNRFASKRDKNYLTFRAALEEKIRDLFIQKGGKPVRHKPHYMILGSCPWLLDWYVDGASISFPLNKIPTDQISFTYGDSFPAMRYEDGSPYRKCVYRLEELPSLISKYGLPQDWNPEGKLGPDRYIEAQIWMPIPVESINHLKK